MYVPLPFPPKVWRKTSVQSVKSVSKPGKFEGGKSMWEVMRWEIGEIQTNFVPMIQIQVLLKQGIEEKKYGPHYFAVSHRMVFCAFAAACLQPYPT
jgi:hypothetical protein